MIDEQHGWNRSYKPLFIGFVLSILLLIAAYRIVVHHELTDLPLTLTIVGLGAAQALVQLFFFLHIGMESKPHWGIITLLFTLLIIFIVIGGSLWIMSNLKYDLMPMSH
jgi:cytochrome o ubiquinol oxidase operon protein cyoD